MPLNTKHYPTERKVLNHVYTQIQLKYHNPQGIRTNIVNTTGSLRDNLKLDLDEIKYKNRSLIPAV